MTPKQMAIRLWQAAFLLLWSSVLYVCFYLLTSSTRPMSFTPILYVPPHIRAARPAASDLRNLVMVAGHAIYSPIDAEANPTNEKYWSLDGFMKGQLPTILEHIRLGVEAAALDPEALLLFSGGDCRDESGPVTEAHSYYLAARYLDWFGQDQVAHRTSVEVHARDSLSNLMNSICRFREYTGHYPDNITVVSFELKRERFTNLHAELGLQWPLSRWSFVGLDDPHVDRDTAMHGERTNAHNLFRSDPLGCRDDTLLAKRRHRNRQQWNDGEALAAVCPEMRPLLQWCRSDAVRNTPATRMYPLPDPLSLPWHAANDANG